MPVIANYTILFSAKAGKDWKAKGNNLISKDLRNNILGKTTRALL